LGFGLDLDRRGGSSGVCRGIWWLERRSGSIDVSPLVGESRAGLDSLLGQALALLVAQRVEKGQDLVGILTHRLVSLGIPGAGGPERADDPELADLTGEGGEVLG
jgi:hypothetical protein